MHLTKRYLLYKLLEHFHIQEYDGDLVLDSNTGGLADIIEPEVFEQLHDLRADLAQGLHDETMRQDKKAYETYWEQISGLP